MNSTNSEVSRAEPPRVCQLITELGPGGAERSVYELSRRLDRRRFDVQVVALRGGVFAERLAEAGVKAAVLGVRGRWDLAKLAGLAGLLRRERIDILHTHLFHADLVGRAAAYLAGTPHLVHTVRTAEARFRPWQFAFSRMLARQCERIVCVSPSVRSHHARKSGLPADRYTVIPNGVDLRAFVRDEEARERLRQEWQIPPSRVLAAYVGRLSREKGIDTLLATMSRLAAQGKAADLVIAGDGPLGPKVGRFVSSGQGERRVRWLGFVPDVRGVLSAADFLVMPSRWEGCPVGLVEAMAVGLPAAASRVAGVVDVAVGGRTALLVPPEDPPALAGAIRRLIDDAGLRARLGNAALRRAREFAIEATVAGHERLYDSLMAGR